MNICSYINVAAASLKKLKHSLPKKASSLWQDILN
jgi:hypothetical protein